MESEKTNEGELTSTMGSFMSTTKEEKSDNSDSTPTSSTDAFTTTSKSQIAADDPISSTSSDVVDSRKNTEKDSEVGGSCVVTSNPTMDFMKETLIGHNNSSPIVSEKDLFDMNISDTSTEKITENVDDLVQDLENLLGEPTTSFDFNIKPRDVKKTNDLLTKRVPVDLDAFSAELQGLEERSTDIGDTLKNSSTHQPVEVDAASKHSKTENTPTNSTTESASTRIQKDPQETEIDNQNIDSLKSSVADDKPDETEKNQADDEQSCQSEIVSASTSIAEKIDVTSTDSKPENVVSSQNDEKKEVNEENRTVLQEQKDVVSSEEIPDSVDATPEDVSKTAELVDTVEQKDEPSDVSETKQEVESSEMEEVQTAEEEAQETNENLASVDHEAKVEDPSPTCASTVEADEHEMQQSNEEVSEVGNNQVEKEEVQQSNENAEELSHSVTVAAEQMEVDDLQKSTSDNEVGVTASEEVIEENMEVEDVGKKEEVEVKSPETVDTGEVKSPEIADTGAVKSHEIADISEVKSPETADTGEVKSPETGDTGEVKSPEIVDTGEVKSPATADTGEVKSPETADTGEVKSPETADTGEVKSPETADTATVKSPETADTGEVKSLEIADTGTVKSPETADTATVKSPETGDTGKVKSPETADTGTVESPETVDTGTEDVIEEVRDVNSEQFETETVSVSDGLDSASDKKETEVSAEVIINQSDDKKESEIKTNEEQEESEKKKNEDEVSVAAVDTLTSVKADKTLTELECTATEPSETVAISETPESTELTEEKEELQVNQITENEDLKQDITEVESIETEAEPKPMEEQVISDNVNERGDVIHETVEEPTLQEEGEEQKMEETSQEEGEEQKMEETSQEEGEEQKMDETSQEEEIPQEAPVERKVEIEPSETPSEIEEKGPPDIQEPQIETLNCEILESKIAEAHTEDPEEQERADANEQNQVDVLVDLVAVDDTRQDKTDVVDQQLPLAVEEIFEDVILAQDAKLKECDSEIKTPFLDTSQLDIPPVEFIPDALDMPTHSLAEDLDLLVQNTVNESISSTSPTVGIHIPEMSISSVDSTKLIQEEAISNPMLPLDVPDLDVLNAISSLDESKSNLTPEADALLASSTLEQPTDVIFESNVLPTVDEIFVEPSQQQDDNLETLLAVASLQNDDYNMTTEGDFDSAVGQIGDFSEVFEPPKVQDTKIESRSEVTDDESKQKLKEPLVINIEDSEKERIYSPKITIKPIKPPEDEQQDAVSSASGDTESSKGSLKMTITKQSDNTHSILKIYNPDDENVQDEPHSPTVPKLIIKSIVQPNEQPHSPKLSTRNSKVFSPPSSEKQRSSSPRITIKPIPKPEESVAPLKITIKPLKTEESHKQKHSPKLTIKPIPKPEEEGSCEAKVHSPRVTIKPIVKPVEETELSSPRVTIKPIVKPPEDMEQTQPRVTIKPIVKPQEESPRITIKPIVKPTEVAPEPTTTTPNTPRLTIKPVIKPPEKEKNPEMLEPTERSSPKITIKPIVKPQEMEPSPPTLEDFEESIKERIVLKINKGTIPGGSKELRKRDVPLEEEKSEKLAKIKVKFSKGGGHPQIVQDQSPTKRAAEHPEHDKNKRQRIETEHLPGVTISPIAPGTHSKLKEMLSRNAPPEKVVAIDDDDDEVTIVEDAKKAAAVASPIVISEESNQDSMNAAMMDLRDPISEIPVFEITPDSVKTINPVLGTPIVEVPVTPPAPRKRGRPRKVPLQVREDFKDPKEEEPKPIVVESTRPKRSCRGQSVRTTLGIKPRKPRGPGRGRGSKRGMGTRSTSTPPETPPKAPKEPKLSDAKLHEIKEDTFLLSESDKTEVKQTEIDDGLQKSPSSSLLAPPQSDTSTTDRADIVMYEEETRMSAETSSRAQTPAKQVVTTVPTVDLVEESQSSVQSIQSTATTESVKVRRGPRLEVHQEPDGAVIAAEQLAEYYWQGGGPYMLQEQVAQFLGIKSFKRKYPNIPRRVVDMQERDFIRESGLAGEAMCDLGLTAVNSSDILDIMYSDFQDKYEEYCKHQRDRQAKDLTNKQRALSLAASQEKTKMDITQQAVQSAANWNANFNKTRREQRKACMDLQTLTVHYPKGKMKQIGKPNIGHYPVALVPGQYTDFYREFTPTELNNLPLNTVLYDRIIRQEMECDSQTDGSGSDSDSSSSDTDSSYSGSSDAEDCTLCKPTPKRVAAAQ